MALDQAICELNQVLDDRARTRHWSALVRIRLAAVRQALDEEDVQFGDGWLAARGEASDRDRSRLLARLTGLGPRLARDAAAVAEVHRLSADLEHYRHRPLHHVYYPVGLHVRRPECRPGRPLP